MLNSKFYSGNIKNRRALRNREIRFAPIPLPVPVVVKDLAACVADSESRSFLRFEVTKNRYGVKPRRSYSREHVAHDRPHHVTKTKSKQYRFDSFSHTPVFYDDEIDSEEDDFDYVEPEGFQDYPLHCPDCGGEMNARRIHRTSGDSMCCFNDFGSLPSEPVVIADSIYRTEFSHYYAHRVSEKEDWPCFSYCSQDETWVLCDVFAQLESGEPMHQRFLDFFAARIVPYYVDAPHYCDLCSEYSLICPHLRFKPFDFLKAFSLFKDHFVGVSLEGYVVEDSPTRDMFLSGLLGRSSPFVLWAAWRAYWFCSDQDPALRDNLAWFERYAKSNLPLRVNAEGIDGIIASLSHFGQTLATFFLDLFSAAHQSIRRAVASLVGEMLKKFLETTNFVEALSSVVLDSIVRNLVEAKDLVMKYQGLICSFVAMCVRCWLGYPRSLLLLELGFDRTIREFVLTALSDSADLVLDIFRDGFGPNIQVEGLDSFVGVLATIVVALVITFAPGLNGGFIKTILLNISTAGAALSRLEAGKALSSLLSYVGCSSVSERELIRLRTIYPAHLLFADLHADKHDNLTALEVATLRAAYSAYLNESARVSVKADRDLLAPIVSNAVGFMRSEGYTPAAKARRQPNCYIFAGPPGIGKTTCAEACARALAAKRSKQLSNTLIEDLVYCPNFMEAYSSGYRPTQDIWKFDDLLQRNDSASVPSPSLALLIQLVNTAPVTLNMAAILDKGMAANCNIVIGSTNVPVTDRTWLANNLPSIADTGALTRRISHVITPILKSPLHYDDRNKCIVNPDPDGGVVDTDIDIDGAFLFSIRTGSGAPVPSPEGEQYWKWGELLTHMWRSYEACYTYVAPDARNDVNLKYLEGISEGWYDAIGWFFKKPCYCGASFPSSCVCRDRQYYVYSSTTVADGESLSFISQSGEDSFVPPPKQPLVLSRVPTDGTKYLRLRIVPGTDEDFNNSPCTCCDRLCFAHLTAFKGEADELRERADSMLAEFNFANYRVGNKVFAYEYLYSPDEARWWSAAAKIALVGACLVVGVAGYASATRLSQSIVDLVKNPCNPADLLEHDGKTFAYDRNVESFVVAEGRYETFVNGRKYVVVTLKNGITKVYPEGYDDLKHAGLFAPRVADQIPRLHQNLFALVNESGALIGNALAVDNRRFLAPKHVALSFARSGVAMLRDSERVCVTPQSVVVTCFETGDAAIFELLFDSVQRLVVERVRDMSSKLIRNVALAGACSFMYRDVTGALVMHHGTFAGLDNPLRYDINDACFVIPQNRARVVQGVESQIGSCGGIYVSREGGITACVLGFHIASIGENRFFHLFDVESILSFRSSLTPNTNFDLRGKSEGLASSVGFACGDAAIVMPIAPKGRTTRLAHVPRLGSKYEPSLLTPCFRNGEFGDPAAKALSKLFTRVVTPNRNLNFLYPFVERLAQCFKLTEKPLRDWNDIVRADVLPSVDRGAVSGVPLCRVGPYKSVLFQDTAVPTLTPDAILLMDRLFDSLLPNDWATRSYDDFDKFPTVNVMALKDEPRELSKINSFSTRLYEITPVHAFLLERRLFIDLAEALLSKNLAFCSALGIDPNDWSGLSEIILKGSDGVLAADFSYMDGSFNPVVLAIVGWFIISIYGNDGAETRVVSPHLPPLNRLNFARWVMLDRIAHHHVSVGTQEFVPDRSHPSGSFLTTIFNILWQVIMWNYVLSKWVSPDAPILGIPTVFRQSRMAFVGDDSLISWRTYLGKGSLPDVQDLIATASDLGFTVTSSLSKGDRPIWYSPWDPCSCCGEKLSDFVFLSRHFAQLPSVSGQERIVGLLEHNRLLKMPCFVSNYKRLTETYPVAVECFAREYRLWWEFDPNHPTVQACELLLGVTFPTIHLDTFRYGLCGEIVGAVCAYVDTHREEFAPAPRADVIESPLSYTVVIPEGKNSEGKEEEVVTQACIQYHVSEASPTPDACPPLSSTGSIGSFASNVTTTTAEHVPVSQAWVEDGMCVEKTNVDRIFSRPVLFASGTTGAYVADHLLEVHPFPSTYFTKNDLAANILKRYAFLRCTVCVRLTGIVNPTVAGKYLLSAAPILTTVDHVWQSASDVALQLDASSTNTVVIKFPTIIPHGWSLTHYLNGTSGGTERFFNFVHFYLWILGTFSSSVSYTMHAWLEDVDLRMPILDPTAPEGRPDTLLEVARGMMTSVRRGIRTFGGVVSDVATLVDTASKMAMLAGFSAPPRSTDSAWMLDSTALPGSANVYGSVPAFKFALCQEQKTIQPMGTWFADEDQMDISYIAARPGIIAIGLWNGGGMLEQIPVGPCNYIGLSGVRHFSPLGYMSLMFRYWRGDITFRIEFDKTPYHTGQYFIAYSPNNQTVTYPTNTTVSQLHHYIVDLAESSSFEFTVKSASPFAWTKFIHHDTQAGPTAPYFFNQTGVVYVRNMSALGSTGSFSVSSAISYRIWAWSDNIEFSSPRTADDFAYSARAPQDNSRRKRANPSRTLRVNPEGGPWGNEAPTNGRCGPTKNIFEANPNSVITNTSTVGEVITNLRPLTRQFLPVLDGYGDMGRHALQNHWYVNTMMNMYAFYSGGIRFWYVNPPGGCEISRLDPDGYLVSTMAFRSRGRAPDFVDTLGHFVALDLPYSQPVPFSFISAIHPSSATNEGDDILSPVNYNAHDEELTHYTAGADDFTFGYFIAPRAVTSIVAFDNYTPRWW